MSKSLNKRIDELVNKDMLSESQKDSMHKMVDSSDKENKTLAREIISIKLRDKLVAGLNDDQSKAFDAILNFYDSGEEDAIVLKGFAGTGKTFLVKRIIELITAIYPSRRIAITAPTNKAVQVLYQDSPFVENGGSIFDNIDSQEDRLVYATTYKLLGLTEFISDNGVQTFKAAKGRKSAITDFHYLVVDEVSMLDDHLCKQILEHKDEIKILFMGDPAQIPPVNRMDCIPFNTTQKDYKFTQIELHQMMRQIGDHPVIDAGLLLRKNLNLHQPIPIVTTKLNENKHGIVHIDPVTEGNKVRPLLKACFDNDKFRADANFAKVIAWTNSIVSGYNKLIREILYGNAAEPYVVGEKLIAQGPIFEKQNRSRWKQPYRIVINTSEEMEVTKVETIKKSFTESTHKFSANVYDCTVRLIDPADKTECYKNILILHPSSVEDYEQLVKKCKNIAIRLKDKAAWVTYYNILKWTANVGYNYAITAHKAQGSTYTHVILIEDNLDLNKRTIERNRIKYTAYSRVTNKLFILRKNDKLL